MVRRLAALFAVLAVPAIAFALPPAPPPSSPRPAPPHPPECRAFIGQPGAVRLEWSDIRRTSSCFFFSGPNDLGRDDQLGTQGVWSSDGPNATLAVGGATFSGTMRDRRVDLARRSTHPFGETWTVTETLRGEIRTDGCPRLVARYHYDECAASDCPRPGTCHIDATLTVRPL